MEDNRKTPKQTDDNASRGGQMLPLWVVLILAMVFLSFLFMFYQNLDTSVIKYSYFYNLIEGNDYEGEPLRDEEGERVGCPIESLTIGDSYAVGVFGFIPPPQPQRDRDGNYRPAKPTDKLKKKFRVELPSESEERAKLLEKLRAEGVSSVQFEHAADSAAFWTTLIIVSSAGLLLFMFIMLRRQSQMMNGGGFLTNFSRSPAKKYEASAEPVTFKDVAGLEGVKADLQEIVEFLSEPTKFQKLGGRVPKGVLLVGPPGTGKTLLARAVAGEAGVPFFSVNGSEFIQMFVGVGASRVRDLFQTAKAQAPAIIFVDEIDAVGRQRGAGLGGGHDEREQTLNQILGEMDGFQANDSVIVLAATNRPDILDPALLRPGRFDRRVTVSRPTRKGRLEIFKVHVRDVPLAKDVDLNRIAEATAGMTGADIQNLVNEAALWAARHNKSKVEMEDFYYAHDKVLMGAKREEVLTEKEKERTAYHEAGHTLTAWNLVGAYPVHKVSIIPRGQALGVTQMVPLEERMNLSEKEIRHNLIVLLAGRAAERLIYDELTVGAENDLERATSMARRMVTHWGMSSKLGPVSYKMTDEDPFLGREMHKSRQFSEHTMEVIDDEVNAILRQAAQDAFDMLTENRDQLEALTQALLKDEELDSAQIEAIIGPTVHKPYEDDLLATQKRSPSGSRSETDGDADNTDGNQSADAEQAEGTIS